MENEGMIPLSEAEIDEIRRKALHFAEIGLYRYKFDGTVIFMDQGAARILDLTGSYPDASAISGKNIENLFIYTGPRGLLRKAIREKGHARNLEYKFTTLTGKTRWAMHDSYLERDEKTGEEFIQVIIKDITWRKNAEQAMREREEWLATVLTSIGDAVVATDRAGKVRFMNPVAEHLTGWKSEDIIGENFNLCFKIINEITREPIDNPFNKVIETGHIVGLANHTVLIARDGAEHPIVDSGAPIRNTEGQITGVVLVFRDDTDRRRSEEAVLRSKNEAEFYLDLMTHDLTNFNQINIGNLNLLEKNVPLNENAARYLAKCKNQIHKSEALISKVKTLSQVKNLDAIKPVSVDLPRLLSDTVAMVRNLYPNKRVTFEMAAPSPCIATGADLLESVAINLIENAVKHSPEDAILIKAEITDAKGAGGAFWQVRIEDRGPGVPDEMKRRIFDRWLRHGTEKGTGLGLSLARAIIEKLGGGICMQDRVPGDQSQGSAFIFTIPKETGGQLP